MGGAHLNFEPGIAGLPPHLASLWGFRSGERGTHTSRTIMLDELSLLLAVEGDVRGRIVVFFPGEYEDGNYRLLDVRDGWSYLAVPITSREDYGAYEV